MSNLIINVHYFIKKNKKKKKKNYDTQYSHVVPHHSTDCAITSLTSEIGRDPVFSSVYGRNRPNWLVSNR